MLVLVVHDASFYTDLTVVMIIVEAGNKEVFRQELRKAWKRQVESRLEFHRLRKNLMEEGAAKSFGRKGDGQTPTSEGEALREKLGEMRKNRPNPEEQALAEAARKKAMPASEAVKVLHLAEATQAEIEKRFEYLFAANGEKGASQYVHDKIVHARDVAMDHLARGTLKKHIKIKRDDAPITEPPKSEL